LRNIDETDDYDFEDLGRDNYMKSKQVYQDLTGDQNSSDHKHLKI